MNVWSIGYGMLASPHAHVIMKIVPGRRDYPTSKTEYKSAVESCLPRRCVCVADNMGKSHWIPAEGVPYGNTGLKNSPFAATSCFGSELERGSRKDLHTIDCLLFSFSVT